MRQGIGTLQESSLHASLKKWYYQPGDLVETVVDGWIVDLVRGNLCIEIQTQKIGAIKKKISCLLEKHPVRVVYPVALERVIVRVDIDSDRILSRRKSPKRGTILDAFNELVYITQLVKQENFSFEILLIREEQIIVNDGNGSWRRKGWSRSDRRLVEVIRSNLFYSPENYKELLPRVLPAGFTVNDLAKATGQPRNLARKMAYSLREIGIIELIGKKGRSYSYQIK